MEITPEIINISDITMAVTGRFIKVLAIILPEIYSNHVIFEVRIRVPHQYPETPLSGISP
jgi:hypothetical protein